MQSVGEEQRQRASERAAEIKARRRSKYLGQGGRGVNISLSAAVSDVMEHTQPAVRRGAARRPGERLFVEAYVAPCSIEHSIVALAVALSVTTISPLAAQPAQVRERLCFVTLSRTNLCSTVSSIYFLLQVSNSHYNTVT